MDGVPPESWLTGESRRALDDRWRLTLPPDFVAILSDDVGDVILTKERYGCLSLWRRADWQQRMDAGVEWIRRKMESGRLEQQWGDVQRWGRLLSTRSKVVRLANKCRLLIPEGFREFLDVAAETEVVVVGAAICVEIWNPRAWQDHLKSEMPEFGPLFKTLAN